MTEWNADQYSLGSSLQQRLARKMLMSVPLRGTERILDLGCGDGKITAEIATQVPRGSVLGVDLSKNMIDFASKNFMQANLRFEISDVCELPYREEFDLVVSFFTLHWVRAQEKALRSIRKALKENGQAWFYIVCDGPRKSIEDVIEDVRHSPRWASYYKGFERPYVHYTPEEYRFLAERNGFHPIQIIRENMTSDFKTRQGFANFIRGTFPNWTGFLPESDREIFVDEVVDRYRSLFGSEYVIKAYLLEAMLKLGVSEGLG